MANVRLESILVLVTGKQTLNEGAQEKAHRRRNTTYATRNGYSPQIKHGEKPILKKRQKPVVNGAKQTPNELRKIKVVL